MARGRRSRSLRSAPTSGFALNQRENHWVALRGLLPFIWPTDRPDLRRRVVAAFCVLVAAKLVTVAIPVAFKEATDALTALSASQDAATNTANGLAIGITMLILAYGAGRIFMMVLNQIRDVFFSVVGQHAVRQLNNRTFEHLHKLSLRFHLERQTGGLSRVIERASRAIELIIRMGILQIVPTLFELLLVCAVLTYFFSPIYAVIVAVTVFVFMYFTFIASEWRMVIRREMNDSDTEANTKAIDSLLNFETVKYFGNERMEAQRFDKSMARYEQAAIRTNSSLGYLNSGQAAIFSIGMTLCLWLSASGIAQGTHTIGDFVMINVMMLQLYVPLNFMGWVYRE
ncbi:MAG: ABC transporter transmembrane domain-containing protein, partial [Pseudomonadota bacterium]